jgi:rhodanese-related sulfurtransferase
MAVKRISPEETLDLVQNQGWSYVDVRSVPEFAQGHPRGAFNIPLLHPGAFGGSPNPEFLSAMERHFSKDAPIVLGCQSSNRSAHAAALLERAGYANLAILKCGFGGTRDFLGRLEPGWAQKGLPADVKAEPGRSWDELSGGAP